MKTYLDCYPCFLRQALQAARLAGGTEAQQQAVVGGVLEVLVQMGADSTPPEIADQVHQLVRREVRNGDPYQTAKQAATQQALELYPHLKARVARADDPLEVALRLSIAGNIMDLGPELHYDLWDTVERVLAQSFAVDDSAALRQALTTARSVLYLTDNAGETVFDRVLIETLAAPVTVAAKGGPILNDATCNDAVEAGLDQIAELISTGTDAPGVILSRCSDAFRARFEEADVVLAKGQANYETLSGAGPKVFCLLQVKCPVIAGDIGAPAGSIAVRRSR